MGSFFSCIMWSKKFSIDSENVVMHIPQKYTYFTHAIIT
jgi:hypothetical protein